MPTDAFGHYKLDSVNVGNWFSKQFAKELGAEKALVQKSGYFARAAAANIDDLRLIKSMVDLAVDCGLRSEPGVIGHDDDQGHRLRAIAVAPAVVAVAMAGATVALAGQVIWAGFVEFMASGGMGMQTGWT